MKPTKKMIEGAKLFWKEWQEFGLSRSMKDKWELNDAKSEEGRLCPCGHIHEQSSNGNGLRTYCVEGSQCNSDKCKDFVNQKDSEVDKC